MCLTGIMNSPSTLDATPVNRELVLHNRVLFGTVNAGRRHWDQAAASLAGADPAWLGGLITRRIPLARWPEALSKRPQDIKVVVELAT
jgi:glucose 1-dehydrogenase